MSVPVADAFLLLSFGGPEGPEDVLPFLRNVTRGRGVPEERLMSVADHYRHFGGVSPINDQNRALIAAVRGEFDRSGIELPIYWGNRNWHPFVEDTVRQMRDDGIRRALVLATSATSSFSGCRQYRNDLARARDAAGDNAPEFVKLRHFFDHPGFVAANADGVRSAINRLPEELREQARLVFTAHSIPTAMNEASGPGADGLYARQQFETARLVAHEVRTPGVDGDGPEFDVVWQSRSGPPTVPWLEPDINDHLRALAARGVRAVVISPTGFVSDHVEVLWDLDEEASETAAQLGMELSRAPTAGTHPAFVAMVRELVEEQLTGARPRRLGKLGLFGIDCADGCCPAPRRPDAASAARAPRGAPVGS
jgi:ferrochelatase